IDPASTQPTIVHLGPSEPIQPQVIRVTSTKLELALVPSKFLHIIHIGTGSRPEGPLQIVRGTSATPKLPSIICLGLAALPEPHLICVSSPG
ncbi:hypothetical protein FRC11_007672, partial [Ceratobasidium sp. 423]